MNNENINEHKTFNNAIAVSQEIKKIIELRIKNPITKSEEITEQILKT